MDYQITQEPEHETFEWLKTHALSVFFASGDGLYNTAIFGEPGTGKSSLAVNIISEHLDTHWVVVIDPHRDITQKLIATGTVLDFIPIDFSGEWVVPLSPLSGYGRSAHQVSLTIIQAFRKIWRGENEWGQNIQDSLLHATKGACDQGGTLWDAYELLSFPSKRNALVKATKDKSLISWVERLKEKEKRNRAEFERYYAGAQTRLTAFLANPILRATFTAKSSVDLFAVAEKKTPLLITPFVGDLGEVESQLVASLILSQLTNLIYAGVNQRILIVADEAHEYITDAFASLLNLRKFDVSVVLISQGIASYEDYRVTEVIRNNCPSKIVFRVSAENARVLGMELATMQAAPAAISDELRSLPDRAYIQKIKHSPPMYCPKTPDLPQLFSSEPLVQRMKMRYGVRLSDVLQEESSVKLPEIPDSAQPV